jgi:hypothetical protein
MPKWKIGIPQIHFDIVYAFGERANQFMRIEEAIF